MKNPFRYFKTLPEIICLAVMWNNWGAAVRLYSDSAAQTPSFPHPGTADKP